MDKKKFKGFKIPKIRLRYRILLYIFMIISIVFSLINVSLECFNQIFGLVCYVIAALTLFAGSYYLAADIISLVRFIKTFIKRNPYANQVSSDYRSRTIISAVPGIFTNILFAVFNGALALISSSAWLGSMSAYYILLSMMRIGVVKQEKLIINMEDERKRIQKEIDIYKRNSILFLFMAVVLGGIVVLLQAEQGGKTYPGFMIYAAAAYTFYRITLSVINMIKTNKYNSPLLMITRKIGYIDACVSVLLLQTAMFSSFGQNEQKNFMLLMNLLTGSVVFIMVVVIGIQGIYYSGKMKGKYNDKYTCSRR